MYQSLKTKLTSKAFAARADCGEGLLEAPGALRQHHDDEGRQCLGQGLGYLATFLFKPC